MIYIDADSLIYAAGFCNQDTIWCALDHSFETKTLAKASLAEHDIQPDECDELLSSTVVAAPVSHAIQSIKHMLNAQITHCRELRAQPDEPWEMYLTGSENFRDALYPEYKANRKDTPKPVHYQALREWCVKYRKAYVVNGQEADDIVSSLLWNSRRQDCIIALDKDLWNTPGWHYNPKKKELMNVSLEEANKNFLMQLLTGDKTDNIPGLGALSEEQCEEFQCKRNALKGVGPATAEVIYNKLDRGCPYELYLSIEELYENSSPKESCLLNAQLLWMSRSPDPRVPEIFQPELLLNLEY